MVVASILGGLGNQMFQYAMARRLAHHLGVELKLDLSEYQNGTDRRPAGLTAFRRSVRLFELCVTASAASPEEIGRLRDPYSKRTMVSRIVRRIRRVKAEFLWPPTHIREKQYCFDPAMLKLKDDVYVDGFWQSEKYFSDAAEVIATEFTPKDPVISRYAHEYVERLRLLGGPVVSLHVRRGDLAEANEKLGTSRMVYGAPVGLEYITAAIARFGGQGRFLVFSDTAKDIEWCKQNIRADKLHFSEGHSDVQDMRIMSACDHHVIANSTFSWWAAWLDHRPGRRVVAPAKWSYPEAAVHMVTDDLIPPGWEVI